jgi:septum site-determining protein MinC
VASANTLTVQRPVRSGQQIYARDADLIVIGQVSPGAELIADGNIHVYGSLQGRAIAGALGRRDVGIFSLDLQAELVAVGGIYRTFEDGVPSEYRGRAMRVELADESDKIAFRPL